MSTSNANNWLYLEPRPGSFYRQLFLKGKRIRAEIIEHLHTNPNAPMTPEEIAADYDLPLAAVQEAIAYCQSNPPEIAGDRAREDALAEATGMNDPNYRGSPKQLSPQERARLMSAMTPRTWTYLAPNPKSAYRQLFIKRTRIRARTLYGMYMSEEEPMTPEEIAAGYRLPVEAVREAIAYCQSDPAEIEQDFRAEEALMEARGMNEPDYKYHGKPRLLTAQQLAQLKKPGTRVRS